MWDGGGGGEAEETKKITLRWGILGLVEEIVGSQEKRKYSAYLDEMIRGRSKDDKEFGQRQQLQQRQRITVGGRSRW